MERRSLINAAMTAPIGFMAAGVMNVADAADSSSFAENVVWMPLKAGVTPSLCVDSMTTQADTVNMKQVGHLPLSKQVEMMLGKKQPLIEVFMFCNPLTAVKMVQANYAFGAYLPCRITLLEAKPNEYGVVMLNLDPLIAQIPKNSPLLKAAQDVNTSLLSILKAGADGSL